MLFTILNVKSLRKQSFSFPNISYDVNFSLLKVVKKNSSDGKWSEQNGAAKRVSKMEQRKERQK